MWSALCCTCCPEWCGGETSDYSSLGPAGSAATDVGSRSTSPKQRAAHAHARDAAGAPFEIGSDDVDEDDEGDDAAFFETTRRDDDAEDADGDGNEEDVEAMLQLELAPDAPHRGAIELATYPATGSGGVSRVPSRHGSPAVRTPILQPPPSYPYQQSTAALPAAAASHSQQLPLQSPGITRADLEVGPQDADLLRFRRALEQAEMTVSPPRPAPVSLPPPTSVEVIPSLQLGTAPSSTHVHAFPALPKVRKASVVPAQSVPTTPFTDAAVPPARPTLQPSAQQTQLQQQQQLHPPAVAHAPSTLVHSPSAPALSSAAAINSFQQPPLALSQPSTPVTPAAVTVAAPAVSSTPASAPVTPPTAVPVKPSSHTQPAAAAAAAATAAPSSKSASGNPLDRLQVPAGPISLAHMEAIMSLVAHTSVADVSYAHLFAFLASASRTLPGKSLRPFVLPELQAIVQHHADAAKPGHIKRSASLASAASLHANGNGHANDHGHVHPVTAPAASKSGFGVEAAKLLIQFLGWMVDVQVNQPAKSILVRFDFGGGPSQKYHYIDMPSQDTWVLSSQHKADPFLVHPSNQPKIYRNESHRLCLHRELLMTFDARGILSLRSGDVSIKKFVSFNADLRTEYRPGMVEYDNARNAFIAMSATDETKPLIIDGRYQPRTFDYWLVVTVLKQENWVGLPTIGPQHPPDLKMKPHKDYAYP